MRDRRKKTQTSETMRMLFLVTQIGLSMVCALAVGGLLGYGADRLFHTLPVFTIIGLFLGVAAGFRTTWQLVANYAKDPEPSAAAKADARQEEAEAEFRRWKNLRDNADGDAKDSEKAGEEASRRNG